MLPDSILTRLITRSTILAFHSIAPLAVLHTLAAFLTYPAPPAVAVTLSLAPDSAADFLFQHRIPFLLLSLWLALEVVWWPVSTASALAIDRGWWDVKQDNSITAEERWRLWVKMLESSGDPTEWLKSFFLIPGRTSAPQGADDPAIVGVDIEKIGRANIEDFIAYFMFNDRIQNFKPKSIERNELNVMVGLLETTLTLSRQRNDPASPPFRFLRGRSRHHVFKISEERLALGHKPLIFYFLTWLASQGGCFALYLAGFRYFGQRTTWPLPLFFMRSSTASLETLLDPAEHVKMGPSTLSRRTGYWFKPARGKGQELDQRPIIFCHGISGTYGPACFIAYLSYLSERAMFIPVHPYLSMRLSPPSTILTRLEYTSSVRRALWRHGFGITSLDVDEDDPLDVDEGEEEESFTEVKGTKGGEKEGEEEWRRGKAIVVAHSAGAGMAGWLMRDAPDIVAGLVLIDPMSFLLYCPDSARNFYRTKCKTAGEHFFKYFASERGINHYLSRHCLWSTSTLFSPHPVSPLPRDLKRHVVPKCARWVQEAGYDVPRYAAEVNGLEDEVPGPFPTAIFLSSKDCILPISKLLDYFVDSRFGTVSEGKNPSSLTVVRKRAEGNVDEVQKKGNEEIEKKMIDNGDEEKPLSSSSPSNGQDIVVRDSTAGGGPSSIRLMKGMEHAAILLRPDWCREVVKAIDQVGSKADEWEHRERIDLLS